MRRPPAAPLLCACKRPAEAPTELAALTVFLWEEWDGEDPEAMAAAVTDLRGFVDREVDLQGGWEDRAFMEVGTMARAEVAPVVEHDFSPAETVGVGLFYASAFGVDRHIRDLISMEDQTPVEPGSPEHYVRTFTEGTPACLRDRSCEVLSSMNSIERDTFLYELDCDMGKAWRWVVTEDGTEALCARSWNVDENTNDSSVRLLQGYGLDIFVPRPGGVLRYHVTWQQTESAVDDEQIKGGIAKGIEDQMGLHDDFLAGR
jgi:hypothetical protein